MSQYTVTVAAEVVQFANVTVEAKSEREAMELAQDKACSTDVIWNESEVQDMWCDEVLED